MTPIGTAWANAVRAATRKARRGADQPSWFDADIAWYVNEREGEMGIRAVPIEPGHGGIPVEDGVGVHDGISDAAVKAATRSRRIENALRTLPANVRLLLQAVHFRISPNAHKDKHRAQEACIERNEGEILVAVSVFRGALRGC